MKFNRDQLTQVLDDIDRDIVVPERNDRVKYRKLRIAWSVVWGLLAVLLIGLWVRSYWVADAFMGPVSGSRFLRLNSAQGFLFVVSEQALPEATTIHTWDYQNVSLKVVEQAITHAGTRGRRVTVVDAVIQSDAGLKMPHWFVSLLAVVLGVMPWLPNRFTLRTLLIVTTLAAVVLGVVVWASR